MNNTHHTDRRPLFIAFCGLPGAGKTTTAKQVAQETGAIRLNVDEWMAALGVDFFDDAFRHKLEAQLYEHGKNLLKMGQSIIFEDGFWTKEERDRYREVAKQLGAHIEFHYFDIPFDELWRRLEKRNAEGGFGVSPITKELLQECWNIRFQKPTKEELTLFDKYIVYR